MQYIVRLNRKAFNPISNALIPGRLWEVEQCANKDSEKVIWHCGDVRINGRPIHEIFKPPTDASKMFEVEVKASGIIVRGQDNAIEIRPGQHDVS